MEYISNSPEETQNIAENFAKSLKKGDVILYNGDLGAGKTTFTKGLAKGLNLNDDVTSPTFAIINEYIGNINLIHFDLYRISSTEDLYSIGFYDYLNGENIIAVEWSENLKTILDDYKTIKISFQRLDENIRKIVIK